jgi:hypothetical protein
MDLISIEIAHRPSTTLPLPGLIAMLTQSIGLEMKKRGDAVQSLRPESWKSLVRSDVGKRNN